MNFKETQRQHHPHIPGWSNPLIKQKAIFWKGVYCHVSLPVNLHKQILSKSKTPTRATDGFPGLEPPKYDQALIYQSIPPWILWLVYLVLFWEKLSRIVICWTTHLYGMNRFPLYNIEMTNSIILFMVYNGAFFFFLLCIYTPKYFGILADSTYL